MAKLILYYIAFTQAIFTFILFLLKKNKSSSSSLLTVLLFVIIIDLWTELMKVQYPEMMANRLPINFFIFAYGPLILLYLRATLMRIKTLSMTNIIHFIPFLVFLGISLVFKGETSSFRAQFFNGLTSHKAFYIVYYSLTYVSVIGYSVANLSCITLAKKNIEDLYSFELSERLLYWFKLLTFLFFITYILQAITGLSSIISGNETFDTNNFTAIGCTIFCLSLIYYMIQQPELFSESKNNFPEGDNKESGVQATIPTDTLTRCAEKTVSLMEKQKLYLKNDLCLQDVARETGYPKHYITQALNVILKKNFYSFVNEYRINEFKSRIANRKNDKLTIMSIAYDSGFNSKSTFNTIFKKFTGKTPSEYAEEVRNSNQTSS